MGELIQMRDYKRKDASPLIIRKFVNGKHEELIDLDALNPSTRQHYLDYKPTAEIAQAVEVERPCDS